MVTPEWKKTDGRLAARCAAVASFGAGVIHFAVTPMHWRDWVLSGLFFAIIAVAQLIWAFFAWSRPTVLVLAAGIALNLGLVALWVTSHTTGAPFGPNTGRPEAVEPAGISVQLLQCYVIMGAAWAWFRGYQAEEVSGFNRAMVMLGAHTVMIGAVTVGLTSSFVGHQHDHGGPAQMQAEDKHNAVTPPAPDSAGDGLPVTDMGLDTSAPAEPSAIAPVPAGTVPEGDGHQHHHD